MCICTQKRSVDYGNNKKTQHILKVLSAQWKVAAKSKEEEEEGAQKACSKDDC